MPSTAQIAATDQVVAIEPIDVMTFNDEGLITSTRAYWSPADVITARGE